MAGARLQYRHLGRSSAHRQALLRNLVTSLFKHESISTTYPKAKEAQRLAEKLISLGKKNTEASRRSALAILYTPHEILPKLFGYLRHRYANRPGGYTRVLRIEPLKEDQAPSAILELVDGPKDMRFHMTAMTVAKLQAEGKELNEMTERNIEKVTRFREDGKKALGQMVRKMKSFHKQMPEPGSTAEERALTRESPLLKRWVYPTHQKEKAEKEKRIKQKPTTFLV